jgi:protein-tyrosine phosphatase
MPTVLDWNPTVDPSELVRHLRDTLAAGAVVVLPGDAGYVAIVNPASPNAAGQLDALARAADGSPAVLAYGPEDPVRLGLEVPTAARRLMFRAWPAGLTVALPAAGVVAPPGWPEEVRDRVFAGEWVRFRCPDHPVFDPVFPALDGPVLVADTFLPTAEAAIDRFEDAVGFAVSVGPRPTEPRPTLVTADATGYTIAEPGAMPADEMHKLAARIILFVCTGNTCRSPLAEGLAKKLLAEKLGCGVEELPARGFWVMSAGTATFGGGPAAIEGEVIAAELGADLTGHRARSLNPQLLAAADDLIVMTQGHAHALAAHYPGVGPAARLLCGDDGDLDDPIGAGLDVYRDCARTIQRHLERLLPEWVGT